MRKILVLIVCSLLLLTGCSQEEPLVVEHKCQEYRGEHEIKHLVFSESLGEKQTTEYYYALYSSDLITGFKPPQRLEFEFDGEKYQASYAYMQHLAYSYYPTYYYRGDNGGTIGIDERGNVVRFIRPYAESMPNVCIGKDEAVEHAMKIVGKYVEIDDYTITVEDKEQFSYYSIKFEKSIADIKTCDYATVAICYDGSVQSFNSSMLGRISDNKRFFDRDGIEKAIINCLDNTYGYLNSDREYDISLSEPQMIVTKDNETALIYIAHIKIKVPSAGDNELILTEEESFIVI